MQIDRGEFLRYLGWKGQATDEAFPADDVLDFVERKAPLFAEKLDERLMEQPEMFDREIQQAFVVEIQKKIPLRPRFPNLIEQRRFSAAADTGNHENFRRVDQRLRKRARYFRRSRRPRLPLFENHLFDYLFHCECMIFEKPFVVNERFSLSGADACAFEKFPGEKKIFRRILITPTS